MNGDSQSVSATPASQRGLLRCLRWTTVVPALIVFAAGIVALLLLLQERDEFSELAARIHQEHALRMQSSLRHVEEYFDAVYSTLLFISVDDDVMAMKRDSQHYIQKLYDRQWQQHLLTEVYVVERSFNGRRPPFLTFERALPGQKLENLHSLSREEDEYRVQIQHLQSFAADLELMGELSSEIFICASETNGSRARGFVYSVPIRSGTGFVGLVAGMIRKSTMADLLRQGLNQQIALLVSERGDMVLPPHAPREIETWFREQFASQGARSFFAQADPSFSVQDWSAHWAPAKIVAAHRWWLVYLHPKLDYQPQTLLTGWFGHLLIAGSLLGLGISLAFLVRSMKKRLDQQGRHLLERKQLEREVHEVSERERQRLGEGLHEDLCQRLTGIEAASKVLEKRLAAASSPEAPVAAEITAEIRTSLLSARQLADELQPVGLLEHGFLAALDELALHTCRRTGIECRIVDHGCPEKVEIFEATHLFRIAQEAVANSVQHARADRITISLDREDGIISMTIEDNGIGIPDSIKAGRGMGLRIMRYRAELIGARLEVRPSKPHGTTVSTVLQWPLQSKQSVADLQD